MPTSKRIDLARAALLVAAFVLLGVLVGRFVAWETVPVHREWVPGTGQIHAPAGEVGSGLDLPLGGER
jgi:hypothetical protein